MQTGWPPAIPFLFCRIVAAQWWFVRAPNSERWLGGFHRDEAQRGRSLAVS